MCIASSFVLYIRIYSNAVSANSIVYYLCMNMNIWVLPGMSSFSLKWMMYYVLRVGFLFLWRRHDCIFDCALFFIGKIDVVLLLVINTVVCEGVCISALCILLGSSLFAADVSFERIALQYHSTLLCLLWSADHIWVLVIARLEVLRQCLISNFVLTARRSQDHIFAFILIFADNRNLLLWHIHLWCSAECIVCYFFREIAKKWLGRHNITIAIDAITLEKSE